MFHDSPRPRRTIAKPIVKYAVMAGMILIVVGAIWMHGYHKGKRVVQAEWDASIVEAVARAAAQTAKAHDMEQAITAAHAKEDCAIEAKSDVIRQEVRHHARKDQKPLTAAPGAIYERLIRLPNEAGGSLPAADPGAGAPEVPRGGMAAEAPARVSVPTDDEPFELTTDELVQAAVDFAEKYALMKNAYEGLSDWNDGRERLELERLASPQ